MPCCQRVYALDQINPIAGPEGARALAAGLAQNQTLHKLDLSWCKLRAPGAEVFASVLASNSTLRDLDLSHNNVGDKGVCALLETAGAGALRALDLSHNNIRSTGAVALAGHLSRNQVKG